MNGYQEYSDDEEVYLSDPLTGDDEDPRSEDDYEYNDGAGESETEYENALEIARSSGVSTPQIVTGDEASPTAASAGAAAVAAAVQDALQDATADKPQEGGAPRGLPGLPPRPKGGLPFLPPRAANKPPASSGEGGSSTGDNTEAPAQPRSAFPVLPPRPQAPIPSVGEEVAAPPEVPEESEKVKKIRQRVQAYRIDTFRSALRLHYPVRSNMLQQLMYRLSTAEKLCLQEAPQQRDHDAAASLALAAAERAEAAGDPLDFSCSVLVLGLAGVGKSALIRSLLGQEEPAGYTPTNGVQIQRGNVAGMSFTFIDTPGLQSGPASLADNLSRLRSAKRAWNRYRPHAVLYVDRMDATRRDLADLQVLGAISDVFGPDIWFSTVLTLTHAGAPTPDGPNGSPIPLETYAQQRSSQVQQVARRAANDGRLMNPVAAVESSPSCPRNGEGEPVLPSGTPWRRQLLMLCCTTKVLNEANAVLKPGANTSRQAAGGAGGFMGGFPMGGTKIPPIGWLLSRLVDFRGPRKPPEDEREIKRDDELDALPPAERSAALRKKRMFLKQKAEEARADDSGVPLLAPEPQLGPSFDADTTSHYFRVLEDPSFILVRPIVADAGVDHAEGVDTVHLEKHGVGRPRGQYLGGVPFMGFCQLTKGKDQFAFQSQVEGSYFHSSKWASTAELNAQTIGSDVLYTQRVESRLKTGRRNKVTAGLILSKLGEDFSLPFKSGALAYGVKLDDRIKISPNAKLRGSVGRVYLKAGASMDHGTAAAADLKLRPGADPSTRLLLGGSAVIQRRDTTYGGNIATEFRLPKTGARGGKSDTMMSANASYNNKGNGSITMRLNSHDYPQLAATMALPLLRAVWDKLTGKEDF